MLGIQPAIPVDFAIVELEYAVFFSNLYIHVVRPGKHFVVECSVCRVGGVNSVNFVDYCADGGVFIEEDSGDEMFVRKILIAEVEMR
jgi:hypothetical protein